MENKQDLSRQLVLILREMGWSTEAGLIAIVNDWWRMKVHDHLLAFHRAPDLMELMKELHERYEGDKPRVVVP